MENNKWVPKFSSDGGETWTDLIVPDSWTFTEKPEINSVEDLARHPKKIAVIGSRGFNNYELLRELLDLLNISEVISGGAVGADKLAERYANNRGIPTKIFYPNYEAYGKGAPLVRNKQIVDNCELVVSFWDGQSRGTKHTMDYATSVGKGVLKYTYN